MCTEKHVEVVKTKVMCSLGFSLLSLVYATCLIKLFGTSLRPLIADGGGRFDEEINGN